MAADIQKDKLKVLKSALGNIEKKFGKGSVIRLGSDYKQAVPAISTGILTLDVATGIGGVPRGRIVEIYGPEASGKTSLTLSIIAEAQKAGGIAAFVDAEHALDPEYAKLLGVNIDDLYVSQPDNGEQALEITEQLVRSSAIDVLVVDSVAALVPRAEIDGEMGDSHMGLQARLMSQALRKLTGAINKSNTCVIFINQVRFKIGVFYGNPETTTGGNALKFYSSMRIEIRKGESLKNNKEIYGNKVKVKIVKNKVAAPFKTTVFEIHYNKGIFKLGCLIDAAVEQNIINKSGSWYSYGDIKLGQGTTSVAAFFQDNPDTQKELVEKVLATLKPEPENKELEKEADVE